MTHLIHKSNTYYAGTLTTKATAVLSAAAAGELAPTHAAQLIKALFFCWLVLVATRTKP